MIKFEDTLLKADATRDDAIKAAENAKAYCAERGITQHQPVDVRSIIARQEAGEDVSMEEMADASFRQEANTVFAMSKLRVKAL